MKTIINFAKAALLLAALAIVGLTSSPGKAQAEEETTFCEGYGHSCHVVIGGTTYHLREAAAN